MKIRLVSDLHIDVNQVDTFGFEDKEQDILLIAGDTAGSATKEIEFLSKIKKKAICIGGNHLGYDYLWDRQKYQLLGLDDPLLGTKENSIKTLTTHEFDNVKYLENQWIEFKNYIIFAGTMYSDFCLYGENNKDNCMFSASRWLNDFRYVYTFDKKEKLIRPVTPEDYIKWNKSFMKELKKCIKQTDKDIIILSHFAPSIKSIDGKYLKYRMDRLSQPGTGLNAAYANNMEEFIKENPRIKLWGHGHCHDKFDYNIGKCRVICSPYGYSHENDTLPQDYNGIEIDI